MSLNVNVVVTVSVNRDTWSRLTGTGHEDAVIRPAVLKHIESLLAKDPGLLDGRVERVRARLIKGIPRGSFRDQ